MATAFFAPADPQHQLPDGSKQPGYTEKLIATLPKQPNEHIRAWDEYRPSVYVDPAQKHFAYLVKEIGGEFIVVDGVAQTKFDSIEHIYVKESHTKCFFFSNDGSRYAYVGRRQGKYVLVVDGKDTAILEHPTRPFFGPDNRLMYVKTWKELRPDYFNGHRYNQQAVIEGLRSSSRPLANLTEPVYINNGKQILFFGWDWEDSLHLFVDGQERRKFPDGSYSTIKVSPDGRVPAYFFKRGQDEYICVNGRDFKVDCPDYCIKETDSPYALISNREHYIYKSLKGPANSDEWRVVIDGKPGIRFDGIGEIVMSDEGRQTAYVANRGEKVCLVVNGLLTKESDDICGLKMTPDGKHLAYVVWEKEKAYVVCDGIYSEPFSNVEKGSLTFSQDGKRLAFSGTDRKKYPVLCVIGEKPFRWTNDGDTLNLGFGKPPVFSQNGKHVAFDGRTNIGFKWTFGVDSKRYGLFDGQPDGALLLFDKAGRLHTVAIRDGKVYVIEADPDTPSSDRN